MDIKILKVGELYTNCYILFKGKNALIIDPGDEGEYIISALDNLNIQAILITHHHFDHVGALSILLNKYKTSVIDYKDVGKHICLDDFSFDIIDTKGHTDTDVTFYFKDDKVMFTGDFLFKDGIGRTDFENSNYNDMIKSINIIKSYPDDITIYPGHGEITNLGYEKNNNIFFNTK